MRLINGIDHEGDPEKDCARDAISELKKGRVVYIYNKNVLNNVLDTIPNIKVKWKEFFWEARNG